MPAYAAAVVDDAFVVVAAVMGDGTLAEAWRMMMKATRAGVFGRRRVGGEMSRHGSHSSGTGVPPDVLVHRVLFTYV